VFIAFYGSFIFKSCCLLILILQLIKNIYFTRKIKNLEESLEVTENHLTYLHTKLGEIDARHRRSDN
jgi:hypothetical protein